MTYGNREGAIIKCNNDRNKMTTNNEEKMLQNQTKEDYETLKEKPCPAVSEYLFNYLHFSEEKHNKHKSKFIDVLQLTFKMGSINFAPKVVKSSL